MICIYETCRKIYTNSSQYQINQMPRHRPYGLFKPNFFPGPTILYIDYRFRFVITRIYKWFQLRDVNDKPIQQNNYSYTRNDHLVNNIMGCNIIKPISFIRLGCF